MTTPLLTDVAFQNLAKLQVKLLPVKLVSSAGKAWNVGELAIVYAEITNTTGLPLRDVVLETQIWGTSAQYQPFFGWDGNGGYVGDLDVDETWTSYCALLKGVAPGEFTLMVDVAAEVVPYGSFWPAYAKYTVEP